MAVEAVLLQEGRYVGVGDRRIDRVGKLGLVRAAEEHTQGEDGQGQGCVFHELEISVSVVRHR
jgi:hypothetical protein